MGINHVALAVKDMPATHDFYTRAMGFDLVKVEVIPRGAGFVRHAFYSTGSDDDQLIAFWDLADVIDSTELKTDICRDLGLDPLTNHLAFQADDVDDLMRRKQRWLDLGHDVLEIDHGWVHSIYTEDPDRIAVEFAVVTRPLDASDAAEAEVLLFDPSPPMGGSEPAISVHRSGGD